MAKKKSWDQNKVVWIGLILIGIVVVVLILQNQQFLRTSLTPYTTYTSPAPAYSVATASETPAPALDLSTLESSIDTPFCSCNMKIGTEKLCLHPYGGSNVLSSCKALSSVNLPHSGSCSDLDGKTNVLFAGYKKGDLLPTQYGVLTECGRVTVF